MTALRRLLIQNRVAAACLVLLALCMKVVVPAGFMPMMQDGTITVSICTGMGPQTVTMAMPGMADHDADTGGGASDHETAQMPCAFAGLGLAALAAVDPVILAIALAFVLASGFVLLSFVPILDRAYLRPPLRGPPRTA